MIFSWIKLNTALGSHFPGGWKCLSALVEEMPRVGSPEGLTVQACGSWGRLLHPSCWGIKGHLSQFQAWSSPSLWSSKESVNVLCLVQPSHHRGGAAGPQGGTGLVQSHPVCGRVRVRTRCPFTRLAVCSRPHTVCDKCGSSILQTGILPHPPSFCTNLPHPPEEGTHCWVSLLKYYQCWEDSMAHWGVCWMNITGAYRIRL